MDRILSGQWSHNRNTRSTLTISVYVRPRRVKLNEYKFPYLNRSLHIMIRGPAGRIAIMRLQRQCTRKMPERYYGYYLGFPCCVDRDLLLQQCRPMLTPFLGMFQGLLFVLCC